MSIYSLIRSWKDDWAQNSSQKSPTIHRLHLASSDSFWRTELRSAVNLYCLEGCHLPYDIIPDMTSFRVLCLTWYDGASIWGKTVSYWQNLRVVKQSGNGKRYLNFDIFKNVIEDGTLALGHILTYYTCTHVWTAYTALRITHTYVWCGVLCLSLSVILSVTPDKWGDLRNTSCDTRMKHVLESEKMTYMYVVAIKTC